MGGWKTVPQLFAVSPKKRLLPQWEQPFPLINFQPYQSAFAGKTIVGFVRACLINENVPSGEGFFRQSRQIFAGTLGGFQENLTQSGGKRTADGRGDIFQTSPREALDKSPRALTHGTAFQFPSRARGILAFPPVSQPLADSQPAGDRPDLP